MRKPILLTLITLLFLTNISQAQNKKVKFGKIHAKELQTKICPLDSNAHAEILYDCGYTYFKFTPTSAKLVTKKHTRIKIYDKEGYRYTNVAIAYFDSNMKGEENISRLKAYTYNLENGKVVKTQLDKKGIFIEHATKNVRVKKFTFPDIKEGSIIEYRYTKTSDFFFKLKGWQFQYDIPVRYSKYNAIIPEDIHYKQNIIGYEKITRTVNNTVDNSIYSNDFEYIGQNIQAFPDEKFIACKEDYISRVDFELQSAKLNGFLKNFTDSWNTIHRELMLNSAFGVALKRKAYLKKLLPGVIGDCKNDMEKTQRIFEYVRKNIKWNGYYSIYAGRSFRQIHQGKSGNSGEINLFLTTMLRSAGLQCDPVLISTKNNGRIRPGAPKLSQYNHCLSCVTINEQMLLLDAIDNLTPINLLPYNDYNYEGVLIANNGTKKISLRNKQLSNNFITINASFNENGQLTGELTAKYSNYNAYTFRKEFSNPEQRIEKLEKHMDDFTIQNYKTKNLRNPYGKLEESYDFTLGEDDELPMSIYLPPLLHFTTNKNPFKLENRKFPVDYPYPEMEYIIIEIELPEGYQAEELPKNISVVTPDKSCAFIFNYSIIGNKVKIMYQNKTLKTLFLPNEYMALKQFYDILIKKHSEKIVLKKKS